MRSYKPWLYFETSTAIHGKAFENRSSQRISALSAIGENRMAISFWGKPNTSSSHSTRIKQQPGFGVDVMVRVRDVAIVLKNEIGDAGHKPALVGATKEQHQDSAENRGV
jgi:hypothetical protein